MTEVRGRSYPNFRPALPLRDASTDICRQFVRDWGFNEMGIKTRAPLRYHKAAVWVASRCSKWQEVPILAAIVEAKREPASDLNHWFYGVLKQNELEALKADPNALANQVLQAAEHGPNTLFESCEMLKQFVEPKIVDLSVLNP